MRLWTFATSTTLLAGVLAGPVAKFSSLEATELAKGGTATIGALVKRAREGLHMLDCGPTNGKNSYSALIYCADDGDCGYVPAKNDIFKFGGLHRWESKDSQDPYGGKPILTTQSVTFSSGVNFAWRIVPDAQKRANYEVVGLGSNDYHSDYRIYKDDKHTQYRDGNGIDCKSIYYILR